MKESVSALFSSKEFLYFIKRQNYLSVFPGYHATPGGKVDKEDSDDDLGLDIFPKTIPAKIHQALIREVKEELNFDLLLAIKNGLVQSIDDLGIAITPEFNPYRFKNYYIKITLNEIIQFDLDCNESEYGEWVRPSDLLHRFQRAEVLAVPPLVMLLKAFDLNPHHHKALSLTLPHNPETEVPMIESLFGVRQFLPLSNTFPPANRTNCFIIGDETAVKVLIDPSPKNENEYQKLIKSLDKIGFEQILLTHHHPDHYEYSRDLAKLYNVPMLMSDYTYKAIGHDYFKGINILIIKEGDVITKSLDQNVVAYEVPGHDEGQIALAPSSMNWFLVGDLIQTIGTVVIGAPEGDMNKYFKSLSRVIDLNPKFIIPSHGIILGGTNKLTETLQHRIDREIQIKSLLNSGKSKEEILKVVYADLKPDLIPYAIKTIEAHLVKILKES